LAGSPLNAPEAMTVLPNGNLMAANTAGGNTLVEIDVSTGKVLATKTVDTGKSPAIFALQAAGKNDTNTVLYYTDTNDNSLHELEQ
jgi:DNA-binding beta-propeller fold protein YncE